jgi:hypothetical protein
VIWETISTLALTALLFSSLMSYRGMLGSCAAGFGPAASARLMVCTGLR